MTASLHELHIQGVEPLEQLMEASHTLPPPESRPGHPRSCSRERSLDTLDPATTQLVPTPHMRCCF